MFLLSNWNFFEIVSCNWNYSSLQWENIGWLPTSSLYNCIKKSKIIIINSKLNSPTVEMSISCKTGRIESVQRAKYLGILIDEKLNLIDHIKNLEIKISRSVGILSKLKYYLPEGALLKLYYSMVHSHLNYGLAIWGNT